MLTRRTFIPAIACAALATPAAAADTTARTFVSAIYDAYKGKNSEGVALDGARTIRRYFEPSLAILLVKDQNNAARRHEVGKLDFDPFVDGQDWDVTTVDIAMTDSAPDRATATVGLNNFGKPSTVVLDLVKVKNDWRINDITWNHDGKTETMRGLFAH